MENNINYPSDEQRREVSNRLARAIGHLQKVKQMVDNNEKCSDVLIQLSAVKSAINNTGKIILKDHIEESIAKSLESGDSEIADELGEIIDKFIK